MLLPLNSSSEDEAMEEAKKDAQEEAKEQAKEDTTKEKASNEEQEEEEETITIRVRMQGVVGLIVYEMEPSDTMDNIKAKLQDTTGSPASEMSLHMWNHGWLENGRTLSDYNIQRGDIHTLVCVVGGM